MIIKSNTTYQFIKDLLRNNKRLSFTSDAFSHGQGAAVYVNRYSKEHIDEELNDRLSYLIYTFMQDYMVDFSLKRDRCRTHTYGKAPVLGRLGIGQGRRCRQQAAGEHDRCQPGQPTATTLNG